MRTRLCGQRFRVVEGVFHDGDVLGKQSITANHLEVMRMITCQATDDVAHMEVCWQTVVSL